MQVPGEEGLRDIRIVEAIYKAAATRQRVALLEMLVGNDFFIYLAALISSIQVRFLAEAQSTQRERTLSGPSGSA